MNTQRIAITQAGAATTELVAAPGVGKKIVVWGYTLVQLATGTAVLKSGSTALTGVMPGGVGVISPTGPGPIHECAPNAALNLVTATLAAFGELRYTIEPGV